MNLQPHAGFYTIDAVASRGRVKEFYDSTFYADPSQLAPSARESHETRYTRSLVQRLRGLVGNPRDTIRILDVGCGRGARISPLKNCPERRKWSVLGVDFSAEAIQAAGIACADASFAVADAMRLPLGNCLFDAVTCWGSLEHFPDMAEALGEMKRVKKAQAPIYLEVPNLFSLLYLLRYAVFGKSPGTGQVLERLGSREAWEILLRECGLEITDYWSRTYRRPFSVAPIHEPLSWLVARYGDHFLPERLRENHCFIAR